MIARFFALFLLASTSCGITAAAAAAAAAAAEEKRWFGSATPNKDCEVQRREAYECAIEYADLNNDSRVSKPEVVYFRTKVMRWWEKDLMWAIRETPEKIMDRCAEWPQKTHITRQSIEDNRKHCLENCRDWRLSKKMCDRMDALDRDEVRRWKAAYPVWRKAYDEKNGSGK